MKPTDGKLPELSKPPHILVDRNRKIAFMWSAKAGCTFGVKWFFAKCGLLDDAIKHYPWIHDYTLNVYIHKDEYNQALDLLLERPEEFAIIKLVRNPFNRVVSSYIHANRVGYEDKALAIFLKRLVNRKKRFSFKEFVRYLESISIYSCDIHHRQQIHPVEIKGLLKPTFVVKLESSVAELSALEKKLDLGASNFGILNRSHHCVAKYQPSSGCCSNEQFLFQVHGETNAPEVPFFFDKELEEQVINIYDQDYAAYRYSKSLIDLPASVN